MIEYKNYKASISYDEDMDMLEGKVLNTRDIIIFYANSVQELKNEMKISIDGYLAFCEEKEIKPAKPYSGKFNLRIDPDLHMRTALAAANADLSLNAFVENALEDCVKNKLNVLHF